MALLAALTLVTTLAMTVRAEAETFMPLSSPVEPLAFAAVSTSGYTVTRSGSTYTATPDGGGTPFSGTLKFAVESAMYDLSNSGGGTITFTSGIFDLGNSWFELDDVSNVTFQGQGMDATVIQNNSSLSADTEPFDGSTTENIVIRDLQVIAGGSFRSTSDAIDFDGGNNGLIERVKITGSRARGIIFDGKDVVGGTARTADGNTVRDCVIAGVPSHGIQFLASRSNRVEGCTITDVAGYGIQVTKSSTSADQPNKKSNENVLAGNLIDNAGQDGIAVGSSDGNDVLLNTVLNSSDDVSGRSGIRVYSSDSVECNDNLVSSNTATDNQATKTQAYGLRIASSSCHRTVVSGNDFSGNLTAPIRDDGTDTQYPPPDPLADLSLTKTDSPDPVSADSNLTYTLDVANAGPSNASAVTVTDSLPAGVTYLGASPSQGSCSEAGGTVTCDLATLAGSASASIEIVVRPQSEGPITNTASVTGAETDPDPTDNGDSEPTTVNPAPPAYPRPGGGTPLRVPLVAEFAECTPANANANHAAPLDAASCSPPAPKSSLTTSAVGRGQALARLDVRPGNTSTATDEADVDIHVSATDVQVAGEGSDYSGEVVVAATLRITDRASGPNADQPATVSDVDFSLPVDCVATPDPDSGASCSLSSTVDTLVPGFARERARSVISTFSLALLDAGADGSLTPATDPLGLGCPPTCGSGDEEVFLRQGVFAP
jgi:uncharacterized repeat protein (TIGR01451 family)